MGVSGTAIYKVVTGRQEPGGKILAGLARLPSVNSDWVLTGEGEPFRTAVVLASNAGDRLPVLDRLLPGPPSEHEARLAGREMWVAATLVGPTRYVVRIRGDDPITRDQDAKVAAGDLALIETDRFWDADPSALDGRILALDLADGGIPDIRLGVATLARAAGAKREVAIRVRVPEHGTSVVAWTQKPVGYRRLRGIDPSEFPDFSRPDDGQDLDAGRRPERVGNADSYDSILGPSAVRGAVLLLMRS